MKDERIVPSWKQVDFELAYEQGDLPEFGRMDKIPMKKKLKKLGRIISVHEEFRVPLAPDGKPYKEDHKDDDELKNERNFILKTLKK